MTYHRVFTMKCRNEVQIKSIFTIICNFEKNYKNFKKCTGDISHMEL